MINDEINEALDESDQIVEEIDDSDKSFVDRYFGITKKGSSFRIEIIAGLVTFLSMAYILTLNPTIIAYGSEMPHLWSSLFIATALGATIGTLIMALLGKMPFGLATGLGLNSMLALLISGNLVRDHKFSFGTAIFLIFISGILFLLLSVVPIKKDKTTGRWKTLRELVFEGMPINIRRAISVGIGLFIAFIGLQNAGIIVHDESTLVGLLPLNDPANWKLGGVACGAIVALIGFIIISVLSAFKVKGALIIGILSATILAIPLRVADVNIVTGNGGYTWEFWTNFATYFKKPDDGGVFLALFRDIDFQSGTFMACVMVVITFSMIDMFDTMGTVVGCASNAGLIDKDGKPENYNKIMLSDSFATLIGAFVGTSTVTTFVESGSGIASGGRTGFTALTTSVLFFLSIFLLPIFAFIPLQAASAALFYVGVIMMAGIKEIDFKNPLNAIPAFTTIIFMPLAFSITDGIGMGLLSYIIIHSIAWVVSAIKAKVKATVAPKWDISIITIIFGLLFLVYFFVPIGI